MQLLGIFFSVNLLFLQSITWTKTQRSSKKNFEASDGCINDYSLKVKNVEHGSLPYPLQQP